MDFRGIQNLKKRKVTFWISGGVPRKNFKGEWGVIGCPFLRKLTNYLPLVKKIKKNFNMVTLHFLVLVFREGGISPTSLSFPSPWLRHYSGYHEKFRELMGGIWRAKKSLENKKLNPNFEAKSRYTRGVIKGSRGEFPLSETELVNSLSGATLAGRQRY